MRVNGELSAAQVACCFVPEPAWGSGLALTPGRAYKVVVDNVYSLQDKTVARLGGRDEREVAANSAQNL